MIRHPHHKSRGTRLAVLVSLTHCSAVRSQTQAKQFVCSPLTSFGPLGIEPSPHHFVPQKSPRFLVKCKFEILNTPFVGPLGIEPSPHAPKACILPIYYGPTKKTFATQCLYLVVTLRPTLHLTPRMHIYPLSGIRRMIRTTDIFTP